MHTTRFLIVAAIVIAARLDAQGATAAARPDTLLRSGRTARVVLRHRTALLAPRTVIGTITAVDADTLQLAEPAGSVHAIGFGEMRRLDVSSTRRSRYLVVATGALSGAASAGFGALVLSSVTPPCKSGRMVLCRSESTSRVVVSTAPIGALLGAAFGLVHDPRRWIRVTVPVSDSGADTRTATRTPSRASIVLAPTRVALALRF